MIDKNIHTDAHKYSHMYIFTLMCTNEQRKHWFSLQHSEKYQPKKAINYIDVNSRDTQNEMGEHLSLIKIYGVNQQQRYSI